MKNKRNLLKRITAILLVLFIQLPITMPVTSAASTRFDDIGSTHWVSIYLNYLERFDVVVFEGYHLESGRVVFRPNQAITRAEFAKVMVTTFLLYDENAHNPFTDVNPSAWYSQYISSATSAGLLRGISTTQPIFAPGEYITRQEAFAIIGRQRMKESTHVLPDEIFWDAILSSFPDGNEVADWAQKEAVFLIGERLVRGRLGGGRYLFAPEMPVQRSETAAIIKRVLEHIRMEEIANRPPFEFPTPTLAPETTPPPVEPTPIPTPIPTPTPEVDRSELQAIFDEGMIIFNYSYKFTRETWNPFLDALFDVGFRYLRYPRTQERIDGAVVLIREAIDNLEKLPLEEWMGWAIRLGRGVASDGRFTQESFDRVQYYLDKAIVLYNDENRTYEESCRVVQQLVQAVKGLERTPRFNLRNLIDLTRFLVNMPGYTEASREALRIHIEYAQSVYDDPNTTDEKFIATHELLLGFLSALEWQSEADLRALIEEAFALADSGNFTTVSTQHLYDVTYAARRLVNVGNPTEAQMDEAAARIRAAINALVPR